MIIGSPEYWVDFIDDHIPDILAAVIESWRQMVQPLPDALEDRITEALCRALKQDRTVRGLPFQIHVQSTELEPAAGEDVGCMDIAFYAPTNSEEYYFCVEAKRLNVIKNGTVRSYASEYVRFGMMRFITGQYAKSMRNGAMIGYVVDGRVAHAIANVEQNIRNQHVELGMTPPGELLRSTIIPDDDRARETQHTRRSDCSSFRIHHLFMTKSGATN
ncbi:MAG TPA: hypothetical protein VMU84_03935 [Thermoanaerobaculia bacterium]|nr:hypothetical protein [Thermoanaerobaculia bacterium]